MGFEIDNPSALSADEVAEHLQVDILTGLNPSQVQERLRTFGRNVLAEHRRTNLWSIAFAQFNSLVVYLLLAAAAAAFAFGETVEGFAVLVVVLINAAIGFAMEIQAVRSMEALRKLARVHARVRRDGRVREVESDTLVPGDVLLVDAGDVIAADARLVDSARLEVDESTLTGESVPVAKSEEVVPGDVVPAERANMLFRGTAVTRGTGTAVVVRTGMQTELGAIAELVESAEQEATPLEEKLNVFSRKLVVLTILLAVAIVLLGVLQGDNVLLLVETAIALSVAAIPEGLPIVATIALAQGMLRMARRNVLVRRLASVETLGGTTVICTDKTGTLTENRLTVAAVALAGGTADVQWSDAGRRAVLPDDVLRSDAFRRLVEVTALCNNASYQADEDTGTGDPLEVALLKFAVAVQADVAGLRERCVRTEEEPFDAATKIMVTIHDCGGEGRTAAKGAPEAVLDRCAAVPDGQERALDDSAREEWLRRADELSADGLRVLAFADGAGGKEGAGRLSFLGLVGFLDPPRGDVAPALQECTRAGIRVVMVTGDHPATATAIAERVGLVGNAETACAVRGESLEAPGSMSAAEKEELLRTHVFARVTPKQKLGLIQLYQERGDIVAMTGDGVNDAPALKKADIGIAMGKRGTQIAREAATMILEDDAFTSIVEAVRQGRIIFSNIRKFVVFLLSCNISEIFVVSIATFAELPLPLLPLQILFLNLVTDVFPALALGVGPGDPGVMTRPPRNPGESILPRERWTAIIVYGAVITLSVLGVVLYCDRWLGLDSALTNNVAFVSLTLAQLWHVFNIAPAERSFFVNDVTTNVFVWPAILLCLLIVAGAFWIEPVRTVLQLTTESLRYWEIALAGSIAPVVVNQALKRLKLIW